MRVVKAAKVDLEVKVALVDLEVRVAQAAMGFCTCNGSGICRWSSQ